MVFSGFGTMLNPGIWVYLLLALSNCFCCEAKRKMSISWNPDCPSQLKCSSFGLDDDLNSVNSLLHFVAVDEDDSANNQTVHVLFSTVGGPAILVLLTDPSAIVKFNWTDYLNVTKRRNGGVAVNGTVNHAVGIVLTRIWKFNDAQDLLNVDAPSPADAIEAIPLENLLWKNVTIDGTRIKASLVNSQDGDDIRLLGKNGTVGISIEIFDSSGRSDALPRLPHTDIGCQLDIELINIDVGNFTQPRLAIETTAISKSAILDESNDYTLTEEKSIDDEYTPGVFRTYFLSMPRDDGFVMWKPVAYRDSSRSFSSFTRAKHGDAKLVSNTSSFAGLNMSNVVSAFFNSTFRNHAVAFNMTLGLPKDKFYSNYRYLVWSLGIGWGSKPPETLSTLVIILLVVCSAFPAVVLFIGVPCLIRRKRRTAVPYENLIDDS